MAHVPLDICRPPSLDTINRTFRNIDLAIDSQVQQIEELTRRVSRFNIDALDVALRGPISSSRNRYRHDTSGSINTSGGDDRGLFSRTQVTPSIAASTAAALNAERNALRLKNALAKVRTKPLKNNTAVEPTKRIPTLESLQKPDPRTTSGQAGSPSVSSSPDTSVEISGDRSDSENQRRHTRQSQHAKPVKLGKTHTRVPSSITNFDWGPLPKVGTASSLPFDIQPR